MLAWVQLRDVCAGSARAREGALRGVGVVCLGGRGRVPLVDAVAVGRYADSGLLAWVKLRDVCVGSARAREGARRGADSGLPAWVKQTVHGCSRG